ncbi:hypothetical protein N7519_003703 [Penicillium mononematosum]|uniref:uncharacterized protein n=1 Tax=Penicillium mononematosum TaxID=268346 RepID=UPI00254786B0|nr:uncharacterized protein N7519_003703 [Penicillium mononematosum]KAJ6188795.1 hypothetical protein N7519_003703 [Penicillium mononematosum]
MANESVFTIRGEKERKEEKEREVVQSLLFLLSLPITHPFEKEKRVASQGDQSNKPRQSQTESSWTQNSGSRTERKDGRLSAFWYIEGDFLSSGLLSETDG